MSIDKNTESYMKHVLVITTIFWVCVLGIPLFFAMAYLQGGCRP